MITREFIKCIIDIYMGRKIKISEYCKNKRLDTGLSVYAFAQSKGVSHTYVNDVESGQKDKPSLLILSRLMNVYDLTNDELVNLDLDPWFIDELSNVQTLFSPIGAIREKSYNRLVNNFINSELIPKGYTVKTIVPLKNNKSKKSISVNKDLVVFPAFDAEGITPEGDSFLLYALASASTSTKEDIYYDYIFTQIAKFILSVIKSDFIYNSEKNIEVIFLSSSAIAHRLSESIINDPKRIITLKRINIKTVYFDNRKGKKNS